MTMYTDEFIVNDKVRRDEVYLINLIRGKKNSQHSFSAHMNIDFHK